MAAADSSQLFCCQHLAALLLSQQWNKPCEPGERAIALRGVRVRPVLVTPLLHTDTVTCLTSKWRLVNGSATADSGRAPRSVAVFGKEAVAH